MDQHLFSETPLKGFDHYRVICLDLLDRWISSVDYYLKNKDVHRSPRMNLVDSELLYVWLWVIFVDMFYHVCHLESFPHSVFFYWGELRTVLSPQFPLPKSNRFAFLYIALNSKINGIKSLKQGKCILNTSTLLFWIATDKYWKRLVQ